MPEFIRVSRARARKCRAQQKSAVEPRCCSHKKDALDQADRFVVVHVGFALSIVDEAEAEKVFEYLREMGELEELKEAAV